MCLSNEQSVGWSKRFDKNGQRKINHWLNFFSTPLFNMLHDLCGSGLIYFRADMLSFLCRSSTHAETSVTFHTYISRGIINLFWHQQTRELFYFSEREFSFFVCWTNDWIPFYWLDRPVGPWFNWGRGHESNYQYLRSHPATGEHMFGIWT